MASNESGDISFFKEIASLLQKAQENKYHKITFHGWNKDLNDILAKRYDFVKVRTDSINGTSVDYFEKNLMTKQTPSQNQQEAFYQKNILRIQSLLEKTLASCAEQNPEKIQHIQKTFSTVEQNIQGHIDSYEEMEQLILHLKLARHFQKHDTIDTNVLSDALIETPKFLKKDKGSLTRLFEIHQQKTLTRIAEMRKQRAEITGDESFNPYEALTSSDSGDYFIARLLNMPHLEEESEYMNHCVGISDSYINKIKKGDIDILSIRTTPTVHDNQLTGDKPIITIEYNRKTGVIEQMKKYDDKYLSTDDPYYHDVLDLLNKLHSQEIDPDRSYPISKINASETENITLAKNTILLSTGEEISLQEYNPDMADVFVIKANIPEEISLNTSKEDFKKIVTLAGTIEISNDEIAQKFLDGSIDFIAGNLNIDFIAGNFNLDGLTSAEGLKLPDTIGGDLYLNDLTSAEGLKLPDTIGRNLNLDSLTSAEGLKLPDTIGGGLHLASLTSAEGLKLPGTIGGNLYLKSLTSAEGLKLPETVGGDLDLASLSSAEGLKLPETVKGALYLNRLSSAEGLKLPDTIGGGLYLNRLSSAEGLKLPNTIRGGIHLTNFSSAERQKLRLAYPQHADEIW